MSNEEIQLMKFFEKEFYRNSFPAEKVYYVSEYWEKRAEKQREEPSALTSLGF